MNTFLVHVGDDNFYRLLPEELGRSMSKNGRVKVMGFPPLGIQTLAPVLRQRGHQVRMFDTCHPQMKPEHIAQAVVQERPDVIALSFLSTTTYPAAKSMARRLKAESPQIPIIVGGAFATLNADRILGDCPDIDCVGVGEGEELLPDYLNHLDDPGSAAGLVWRRGGKIVENTPRPLLHDLDQFPYPDRTSLPIDYIESLPLDVPAVLSLDKFCTVQTSRGCPYSCIYCDIPALGEGRWRSRSPEHVLGELQELNDLGYRSIYLTDDHFLINRSRIDKICRGIIYRKLEFHWGCEGRVDSVGIEQLPLMRQAGCNFLAFGVEAGTEKILNRLNKKQTPAQVKHAVREAKRQGIARVHGFFVVGSPDETEADILESFRFAARLELDTFGFNRLCAYRGTPLWQEYVARGIIDDERDWHKWFKCSDIDPTTLPSAVVNRLRAKGYGLLFLHRIFKRPIRTWKLLRAFGRHMKMSDIVKLLYSPFRHRTLTRKPELPARMMDAGLEEPDRRTVSTTGLLRRQIASDMMVNINLRDSTVLGRAGLSNSMNILLLYPEFPDTFWSFKHALKFIRKKASLPPLGLLTVAAMLPKEWAKHLVDVNVRKLRENDLAWADVVFISGMIAQQDSAQKLIARCRAAGKTIVAGGPLFITEHEHFPDVDHFVLNEAEMTLPEFLRDFERGQARRVYASSEFPDIRETPAPLWELADVQRYASMSLQFSRGCPFDCEFCNITAMFGHRPRTKTTAQVIAELDSLVRLGWRGSVFFVDDNFIGNKRALKEELLPALIQWQEGKPGTPFFTEASINLADDAELMQLMVEAGFNQVFVGIETPEEAGLAECNKRQNQKRDLVADVKRIQRAGLEVQGGFIVGFDSDTPTIFARQIEFIQKSGIVTAMVGLLQAVPGTKLHQRLNLQDRLIGHTTGNNVDGTTNFIPRMNRETLRVGYQNLMKHIYSPGPYYQRIRTFLREYRRPKVSRALDWESFRAFLHANVRLGIFGRERFHYWGLLLWTIFRRPSQLSLAVTFSIYGHHFRKTCRVLGL